MMCRYQRSKLLHFSFFCSILMVMAFILLLPGLMAPLPASAANYSCDETGLDQALAAGDPAATFNCGGPTTITISSPKVVIQSTGLDGGGLLTISGGDSSRVFSVTTGITLTLNNLIVSHGRVISGSGGTIYNNGTLLVNNSTIANSTASGDELIEWSGGGGGLYNNGTAVISNSSVLSNTAYPADPDNPQLHYGGQGGGIANSDLGTLTVISSTFSNNQADGLPTGGAILNRHNLFITGSRFISNSAAYHGGAIETIGRQMSITNSIFISNTAGDGGGGLYSANKDAAISGSTFDNNSANRGGAIFVEAGNIKMSIQASTFSSNTVQREGGAIWTGAGFGTGARGVTLVNSTLSDNGSSDRGGGIYVNYGNIRVTNSTLAGNFALTQGGNLYVRDFPTNTLILTNTIVAGGSPNSCGSGIESGGHNLEDSNSCGLAATGDITNTDPLLGPLQDNGGATFTHALLPGSPAIDAGDDSSCPATDQRGATRLQDAACDIGAYEATAPTLTGISPISATVGDPGFTLIVTGTRFIAGAAVLWNGSPQTTTYSDSTRLTASIPGGNLTAAGPVTITVRNPDNYESNGLPFTVDRAASTTSLASALNPSVYGQVVTFTATVSSSGGIPTGIVDFRDGVTLLGTRTLSNGTVTFETAALTGGSHSIEADYSGDANFSSSTGTFPGSQLVNRAATTTSVSSAPNPSGYGEVVTFTATVSSTVATPSGTVTFRDGLTVLGTRSLSDGVASLLTAGLTGGSHTISADYNGDLNFDLSTGTLPGGQVVNRAATTTTVSSAPNPSEYGQVVTFTATVSSAMGIPTGTVTFNDGPTVLDTRPLDNGVAVLPTAILTLGTHSIEALYNGDVNFDPSASFLPADQVVNRATTTTTVSSTFNPSEYGQTITLTAIVSSVGAIPTGTVTFKEGTTVLGSYSLAGGAAALVTDTLALGTHPVEVEYVGNSNFYPSSGALPGGQLVNRATTTTTLTSSANPLVYGQVVTFTALVSSVEAIPTGTVTFRDGTTVLGTRPLANGVATLATADLAEGVHAIEAEYGGAVNFEPSIGILPGGQAVQLNRIYLPLVMR